MSGSGERFFPHKTQDAKKEERDSEEGEVGNPRQAGQFMRVRQESEQAGKSVRSLLFFFFFDIFN